MIFGGRGESNSSIEPAVLLANQFGAVTLAVEELHEALAENQ